LCRPSPKGPDVPADKHRIALEPDPAYAGWVDRPVGVDPASEWLETDGLGGFASGTVSGVRTRRYRAWLLAATTPPTGRMVLVNGCESWAETPAGRFALSSHRYAPDVVFPDGASHLESFRLEPWPRWSYRL